MIALDGGDGPKELDGDPRPLCGAPLPDRWAGVRECGPRGWQEAQPPQPGDPCSRGPADGTTWLGAWRTDFAGGAAPKLDTAPDLPRLHARTRGANSLRARCSRPPVVSHGRGLFVLGASRQPRPADEQAGEGLP